MFPVTLIFLCNGIHKSETSFQFALPNIRQKKSTTYIFSAQTR